MRLRPLTLVMLARAATLRERSIPSQFPEHTKESYEAGARPGAGIVECDVTFTKDGELVCRHDDRRVQESRRRP
jgi:glycerophosphoryl diester phosphodiesterase